MSFLDAFVFFASAALFGAVIAVMILAAVLRPRPPHCAICSRGPMVELPDGVDYRDPLVPDILASANLRPCAKRRSLERLPRAGARPAHRRYDPRNPAWRILDDPVSFSDGGEQR